MTSSALRGPPPWRKRERERQTPGGGDPALDCRVAGGAKSLDRHLLLCLAGSSTAGRTQPRGQEGTLAVKTWPSRAVGSAVQLASSPTPDRLPYTSHPRLGSFFPSQHLHHLRYTPAYDCKHGLGLTRQIMSLSFNPLQALHATYLLSLESLASHPTTLLELMAGFGTSFAPQIAPPPCFLASSRIRIQRSR